jgi:hypothetical protein
MLTANFISGNVRFTLTREKKMSTDLIFMFLCFLYFLVTAAIIVGLDFLIFMFTGKSILCAVEHFLFDKFGQ